MIIRRACKVKNYIWFIETDSPCLYRIDITDQIAGEIEGMDLQLCKDSRFSNIVYHNDSLFLIPQRGNVWVEYQITKERYQYFTINLPACNEGHYSCFIGAIPYKEYLYSFGWDYAGIVCLNTITGDSIFLSVSDRLKNLRLELDTAQGYFSKEHIIVGSRAYIPFSNTNAVLMLDLEKKDMEILETGMPGGFYQTISCDGSNLYLFPLDAGDREIVKYTVCTGQTTYLTDYPARANGRERAFYMALNFRDRAILVSDTLKMNMELDYKTGRLLPYPGFQNVASGEVHIYQTTDNSIFYMNHELWGLWDCTTRQNSVYHISYDQKIRAREYRNRVMNNGRFDMPIQEDSENTLYDFLGLLSIL